MKYHFAAFEFDADGYELLRNGEVVDATPQVLAILKFLLVSRNRLVTKDELVDEVWDGRAISDAAITVRVRALRQALGDSGSEQRLIRTVRGHGFRFVGDVKVEQGSLPRPADPAPNPAQQTEAPSEARPRIAVLPFELLHAPSEFDILARALPDEILTSLSKLHSLGVIARGSSFQYEAYSVSPRELRQALGVDYSLSGQLELSPDHLRLALELADTQSEAVVWREQYDAPLSDVHALREEVVAMIAQCVEESITQNELRRTRMLVPNQLSSWHAFHRGMERLKPPFVNQFQEAGALFDMAMERDPLFARAQAGKALAEYERFLTDHELDHDTQRNRVSHEALRALELDPVDPLSHYAYSCGRRIFGDAQESILSLQRAIDLSPNFAKALADLSYTQATIGATESARQNVAQALALSPLDPSPIRVTSTYMMIGIIDGDVDLALDWARKSVSSPSPTLASLVTALTSFHMAGDEQQALATAKRISCSIPEGSLTRIQDANYELDERLLSAIAAAHKAYGLD